MTSRNLKFTVTKPKEDRNSLLDLDDLPLVNRSNRYSFNQPRDYLTTAKLSLEDALKSRTKKNKQRK